LSIEGYPQKDYYKVLGVDEDADADEIKKSFKSLAKQYHPDVNRDDPSGERFKEISEAYYVLSNDERRQEYDAARSQLGRFRTPWAWPPPPGRPTGPSAQTPGSAGLWMDWTPPPPLRRPSGPSAQTPGSTDPRTPRIWPPPPGRPTSPSAQTPGSTNGEADPRRQPPSRSSSGAGGGPGNRPTDRGAGLSSLPRFTPRARLIALGITAVIVLVLVVLSITVFSSSPGPAATDQAAVSKAEATTVNSVLDNSASSQAELLSAVNKVTKCTDVAGSVSQISQVLGQRASELSEASGLATGSLPNGVPLRSYLVETIRMSQHAEEIFLSWAEELNAHGCSTQSVYSSSYNAAATLFQDAEAAETNFINLWNPVALENGFKPRPPASF
jgi:curved DNA-binding protein CbpA